MKLPVLFKEHRSIIIILSIGFIAVLALYIGTWHPASAKKETYGQVDRQISPVNQQERELFTIIKQQKTVHQALTADWNLFRVARLEARRIASGHAKSTEDARTMLGSLGYDENTAQILMLQSGNPDESIRTLWRNSRQSDSIKSVSTGRRIGTGFATGRAGKIWVVLLANEPKNN
ncbi:hypothetical protein NOM01_02440 [Sporolactobacillus sp. STSJ-5]|uniref:hypothetical protein n=1 Tax=Sporolactobacillus sp. STSJ-5 TaxID=2965076 RepID=UPI0021031F8F|nr:hypothetical protein [Sporolactobacillus sp. STSJ-5]MCQ2008847.1 hypothetical protein [Sporolactobacillus sp. STSJ-5]